MKLGQTLTPNPVYLRKDNSDELLPYLPEVLDQKLKYRISAMKSNGFGTLVKTDRINCWINSSWFMLSTPSR